MMSDSTSPSGLVRSLGLKDAVMIGIASMIGGAIFVLVGPGMAEAGPALMIAFLINGVITLFTALTYAELGSAFPATGGGYRWVREGLPRPNAYISGWMAWFGHTIAGSLYAVAFGSFFGHLLKTSEIIDSSFPLPIEKLLAAAAIIIFTVVNIRGSSDTGKVGNAITFTQIIIIAVLIGAAMAAMTFTNPDWPTNFSDFFPAGVTGLALAMGLTFIAFEGYEIISQAGDEIKNPKKNIPRAILISLAIVVTLYILFTFVFIGGLSQNDVGVPSWEFIGGFGELGIIEAAEYFLPFGALIVLAGGLVSTLSALNATTFASSRVSFAMGKQNDLPDIFSKIHSKYRTPYISTIISGAIMMTLALSMDLTAIAFAASVMFLFLFTQVNFASITIRRIYEKKVEYGFKTPLFPLIPIAGIITAVGLSVYLLFTHPESWLIAIVWVGIGFLIFKFYTSKKEIEHTAPLVLSEGPEERKKYRILIMFNKKTAQNILSIANSIAKQNDGEIIFLNTVNVPRQTSIQYTHGFGETGMKSFDEFKKETDHSIRYRYMVRLAHDETEAILSTILEQGINTLLADFDFLRNNRKLWSLSTCDIIAIRSKTNFQNDLSNVVVSYDKGRHSKLGLEIAAGLSRSNNSNVRIVRGMTETKEDEIEIQNKINEQMFDLDMKETRLERVSPLSNDVLPHLLVNFARDDSSLLILGAGNQSESSFSPKTLHILEISNKSAIIVRDSRLANIHTREIWNGIASRLRENTKLYRFYVNLIEISHSMKKRKHMLDDEDEQFLNGTKRDKAGD